VDEAADRCGRRIAEKRDIDCLRSREPDQECRHEQQPERHDVGSKRRRAKRAEPVAGCAVEARFPAAAQLKKPDRHQRADQSKTGRDRKCQRQYRIAERHRDQKEAEQRIDDAEEDRMARHGEKIVDASRERAPEIGRGHAAYRQTGRVCRRRTNANVG
jgi:hypothetical protein